MCMRVSKNFNGNDGMARFVVELGLTCHRVG